MSVVVVLLAVALVGRLAMVQLADAEEYLDLADQQSIRTESLPAYRGTIVDRNGLPVALSVPRTSVWADPSLVDDVAATAATLAPALGLEPVALAAELARPGRFVWVQRRAEPDVADQVRALGLAGIFFTDEPGRERPMGDVAAQIIGRVDSDGAGLTGLELLYDQDLTGTPGEQVVERSVSGDDTIVGGDRQVQPAEQGADVQLTLDVVLQHGVEEILLRAVEENGANSGVVLVSTPDSQLLAAANAERLEDGTVVLADEFLAGTQAYELGSVIKPVTAAGVLEDGLIGPSDTMVVPTSVTFNGGSRDQATIEDHDPHDPEPMTVSDVLEKSSNVGTFMLAERLGEQRLYEYLRAFGFGQRTDLGFPGESAGVLPPTEDWYEVDLMTKAIGTTVAVSPLQLLGLYNTIANDGVYVAPHIVSGLDGHPVAAPEPRQVVSAATADLVTAGLQAVVEQGTGQRARIEGYDVAGKTGTAPKGNGVGYGTDGSREYMTSFVGFMPADRPAFTIVVVLDNPDDHAGEATGGRVAGPVFFDIAELALRHLGVLNEYGTVGDSQPDVSSEAVDGSATEDDGRVRAPSALESQAAAANRAQADVETAVAAARRDDDVADEDSEDGDEDSEESDGDEEAAGAMDAAGRGGGP